MKNCPNCNAPVEDDALFCAACGGKIEAPEEKTDDVIAPEKREPAAEEVPASEPVAAQPEKVEKKKKKFLIPAIAAVAVIAIVLVIIALSGGSSAPEGALYLADEELFFTDFGKNGGVQYTDKLNDTDYDIDDEGASAMDLTLLSMDGKRLFYPDRVDNDGFSLYYKKFGKLDSEGVRIDSNLDSTEYYISENGNLVSYIKDGKLCLYNIKKEDKQKIDSDVSWFCMSEDGKTFLYQDYEGDLFRYNKEKDKVDSEVGSVWYISEDFETLIYTKEDNLYLSVEGKDKKKIDSDVSYVINAYSEDEIYYVKEDLVEAKLSAFVKDDLKEDDAKMTEPVVPTRPTYPESPDYPNYWEYDSDEEYDAAYDAYRVAYEAYEAEYDKYQDDMDAYWDDMDDYYDAYNVWEEKLDRDSLREELEENTVEYTIYKLCYYNGKENAVVCEDMTEYDYQISYDSPVILYSQNVREEGSAQYKLSEIYSIYSLESSIQDSSDASESVKYLAKKAKAVELDVSEEATSFYFSLDAKTLYYFDEVDDEGYGELVSIDISKDKPGKSKPVDDDVYYYGARFIAEDVHVYYKEDGEVYMNGEKVDWETERYYEVWDADNKALYYMCDYEDGEGTLKMYKKGKSITVSDDVNSFILTPNGDLLYIYDWDDDDYRGELMLWNGKKSKAVATEVSAVSAINQGYNAYSWNW